MHFEQYEKSKDFSNQYSILEGTIFFINYETSPQLIGRWKFSNIMKNNL